MILESPFFIKVLDENLYSTSVTRPRGRAIVFFQRANPKNAAKIRRMTGISSLQTGGSRYRNRADKDIPALPPVQDDIGVRQEAAG